MTTNVRTEMEALIAAIATAIKADRADIASLQSDVSELEGGGLSQQDVEDLISTAIDNLLDGAPEALDTLKEIADALDGQDSSVQTLLDAIGKRLSFGEAQSLTTGQMTQAQTNAGLGNWAGAVYTLTQIFNNALAS